MTAGRGRWTLCHEETSGEQVMGSVELSMPVLVVDDYRTMLRIIRNLLKQIGFHDIDEAFDGTQALDKLRRRPYRLVISDWNMQPMSGLDLLKQVRADQRLTDLPFVMIAAEDRDENLAAARDAGASGYIVKPFNAATLKSNLTAVGKFVRLEETRAVDHVLIQFGRREAGLQLAAIVVVSWITTDWR